MNFDLETVILRTPDGEMGILADHTPMVVAVDVATTIELKQPRKELRKSSTGVESGRIYAISGGPCKGSCKA